MNEQKKYSDYISHDVIRSHVREKEQIEQDYISQWDTSFNLFKIISPRFYNRETLHSEIIFSIFHTKTPDIHNKNYLKLFVNLLRRKNNKIEDHDFGDKYEVKIEKQTKSIEDNGSIDIFIYDDTHAIIIENKINNAVDTGNQLAKYYKYAAEKLKKIIVAVVYLPLDPWKTPPLSSYSGGYESYKTKIEKVLAIIPVISDKKTDDEKIDFVHGFLDKCFDLSKKENNRTAEVFFEQYIKLLKFRGGKFMAAESDKELFKELFKTKDSIAAAKDIAEIVNKKDKYLESILADAAVEVLKNQGFESFNTSPEMRFKIEDVEDVYIVFYKSKDRFGFGFYGDKEISENKRKKFAKILKDEEFSENFDSKIIEKSKWVCKHIKIDDFKDRPIKEAVDSFKDFLLKKYSLLKEKI